MSGERSKQAFPSALYSLRHFCTAWDPGEKVSKVSEERGSLLEATTDCTRGNQHTKPALKMSCDHPLLIPFFYQTCGTLRKKWEMVRAICCNWSDRSGSLAQSQRVRFCFICFAFSGQVTFILNYVFSFPDKRCLLPAPSDWERLLCLGVQQPHNWKWWWFQGCNRNGNISHPLPPSHSHP